MTRIYYSGPDSVGLWAWRMFLDGLRSHWPVKFLVTFAQCSRALGGGKQLWVLRDWLQRMHTTKAPETGLFFLDSGAHSLYNQHIFNRPEVMARRKELRYDWFDTPAFTKYLDAYAAFVKEHLAIIDYYANVDVIYDPARSWRAQEYLEKEHGLKPVPVVHYQCPLSWVKKYVDAGYELLGVGGLGQGATQGTYRQWADHVFTYLCPTPKHAPIVRTHGFAMTSFSLMVRYPWWSVDSATWTKVGAFGGILVPRTDCGKFTFELNRKPPYQVAMSEESPQAKLMDKHYLTMRPAEKAVVEKWLATINVPLGKGKEGDAGYVPGVLNRHSERKMANLLFFERLREWLGPYPRQFAPDAPVTRRLGAW